MKDNDYYIRTLFDNYRPDMGDQNQYLKKLDSRLKAVEYIKDSRDREFSKCKLKIAVAFICGCIAGILIMAYGINIPGNLLTDNWRTTTICSIACLLIGFTCYCIFTEDEDDSSLSDDLFKTEL